MSTTSFSGPLSTFTHQIDGTSSGYSDAGFCVMSQVGTIVQNSTNVVDLTFHLPDGSQIVDFNVDVTTAFNSGTSADLTIGTSSGDDTYVSDLDAKSAGRLAITYTGAQLGAMADIGDNVAVVATLTPTGATTAGTATVTVLYVQKP